MAKRVIAFSDIRVETRDKKKEQLIDTQKVLGDIEKFLKYEKRYSPKNIQNMMYRIRRIIEHYGIVKPCLEDAIRIEEEQRRKGNGNKTIIHFLQALKLIAEYQGISLNIKMPKLTVRVPDYLNTVECSALLDAANNRRDKALIAVLLYCGLRNKEVCSLNLEDVDIKNRILWIRDNGQGIKNRHERKAILSKEAAKLLNDWLGIRPSIEGNSAVFITLYGDRFRTERLDRLIKDTAKRAGIEKRVYPHLLRHSCATNMLKAGIPVTEVMLQLGHRSLSSTMIYLHGNLDDLKKYIDTRQIY